MSASPTESPATSPEHLVVLIHGIRTQGSWGEMVAAVIEGTGPVKVQPLRYGYFDVFRFLCPVFTRKGPVQKILRELRDIRAAHPLAKISVIAHSFGTYAVMKALQEREIILHRLILCGSIIPEHFRRADYRSQLGPDDVLNDCGTHDIWPPLAKSITWGYGASGTFGLGTHGVRDRFNKLGHGGFFNKDFVTEYWAPYIHEGRIVPTKWEQERNTPPRWQSMLAWFPFKYLFLALIVAGIWFGVQTISQRGEVKAFLGDDIMVGHYTGVPSFTEEVRFQNTTTKEVTANDIRLTLTDPNGQKFPMAMESVILGGIPNQPLTLQKVEAGGKSTFIYTFANYTDAFRSVHQEVQTYLFQTKATAYSPDDSVTLLSEGLTQIAVALAKSEFIWKPGVWRVTVTAQADGKTVEASRTFSLSAEEVDSMWRIIEHYRSGIGVLPNWKALSYENYKPFLRKRVDPVK